jgi:nucleoside-diphosphate-sugar epimerase
MGRVAFITGATGFVGRHLVEQLSSRGWRIRALVRSTSATKHLRDAGAELYQGDLTDRGALAEAVEASDAVFHLAAVTAARSADEYERTNTEGTRVLTAAIAAAHSRPSRFVYLSSYAACGPAIGGEPRALGIRPEPLSAYGRTKLAGEYLAREAEAAGVGVVVIRAPVVYGPGDRALLPYFRLLRWGLAPIPAGRDRKLHLIFASDLAIALCEAIDVPAGTYAVAEPREHRWADVIDVIAAGLGRRPLRIPIPQRLVRSAAAVTETVGRISGRAVVFNREKAEEMLASDWICDLAGSEALLSRADVTPLREGIERTTRWYIRQGWL